MGDNNTVSIRGEEGYITRVAKIAGGAEYTVVVNDENDETPVSSGPTDEDYTHDEQIRKEKSGELEAEQAEEAEKAEKAEEKKADAEAAKREEAEKAHAAKTAAANKPAATRTTTK